MEKKYTESRPWGRFEKFTDNEVSTVKLLYLNPNSALSLQFHKKRNEFWKVINGSGKIIIDDKTFEAKAGDEFYIPIGVKHRLATTDDNIIVLEVSYGYFDEDDNNRLDDMYGRKLAND